MGLLVRSAAEAALIGLNELIESVRAGGERDRGEFEKKKGPILNLGSEHPPLTHYPHNRALGEKRQFPQKLIPPAQLVLFVPDQ